MIRVDLNCSVYLFYLVSLLDDDENKGFCHKAYKIEEDIPVSFFYSKLMRKY